MKVRSPFGRDFLSIKRTDRVLEVGSGNNPTYRSDVIVDKYVKDCSHRGGVINIFSHQTFVNADGEHLPFKDKEFDYVICNHVLEHVEHPEQFVKELSRVAHRGYLEMPSLVGEYLGPKGSHKWAILDIDGKLVMYEKRLMAENFKSDYGRLFINYLPYHSLFFKCLLMSYGDLMTNRYEWKDEIEILVNPTDEKYLRYFTQPWTDEMVRHIFPQRSMCSDVFNSLRVMGRLCWYELKKKFGKRHRYISIAEYLAIHHERYADLVTMG